MTLRFRSTMSGWKNNKTRNRIILSVDETDISQGFRCRPILWSRILSICAARQVTHTGGEWQGTLYRRGWPRMISSIGNIKRNRNSQGKPCMNISKICFRKRRKSSLRNCLNKCKYPKQTRRYTNAVQSDKTM